MNKLLTEPRTGLLHLHDFAKTLKPIKSPGRQVTLSGGGHGRARASRTQAEEVDSTIVQKVADMPGVLGHRAEGVCTAGCEGVHTAGAHVHEHRPRVAVILDVCHIQCSHEPPHKEPGTECAPVQSPLDCWLPSTPTGRWLVQ